jgi:hypothetical protein
LSAEFTGATLNVAVVPELVNVLANVAAVKEGQVPEQVEGIVQAEHL